MAFNLEDKITYDELAPSLQERLTKLRTDIDGVRTDLTKEIYDRKSATDAMQKVLDKTIVQMRNEITTATRDITTVLNDANITLTGGGRVYFSDRGEFFSPYKVSSQYHPCNVNGGALSTLPLFGHGELTSIEGGGLYDNRLEGGHFATGNKGKTMSITSLLDSLGSYAHYHNLVTACNCACNSSH